MTLKVPSGPLSFPIIGNLLQLGDRPYEKMVSFSKKYGPVYSLKLGSQKVVVLNGTEIIRDALINHSEGIYNGFRILIEINKHYFNTKFIKNSLADRNCI